MDLPHWANEIGPDQLPPLRELRMTDRAPVHRLTEKRRLDYQNRQVAGRLHAFAPDLNRGSIHSSRFGRSSPALSRLCGQRSTNTAPETAAERLSPSCSNAPCSV